MPTFGSSGTCEQESVGGRIEQLEFHNGLAISVYNLKSSTIVKASKPTAAAISYGIEAGTPVFESISMTEEEESAPPHAIASGSIEAVEGGPALVSVDGLIILRKKTTLRLSGYGECPYTQGQTLAGFTKSPAVGAAPVIAPSGSLVCISVETTRSAADWVKFTAEFVGYEAAAGLHILTVDQTAGVLGSVSTSYYKITKTSNLTANGPGDIEETVEYYT